MDVAFNPQASEFRGDPYPALHALRAYDPVHFVEMPGLWFLTRYDDVVASLRDPRLSAERFQLSMPAMQSSALISSLSTMMLLRDPPDHTRLRTLVGKAFTPRVVESLRPRIQEIVEGLIDAVQPTRHMELMHDLAAPLARLEGQIAIQTILRRLPALRLETDALQWRDGIMLRGLKSLPLTFGRDDSFDSAMLIAGG
jgi:cytochrome P450